MATLAVLILTPVFSLSTAAQPPRAVGHTDNVGNFPFNIDLSQRRATALVTALKFHGVTKERLTAVGRVTCESDCHQQYRGRSGQESAC